MGLETSREARRGRSLVDQLMVRLPRAYRAAARWTMSLPRSRLRQALLELGHRRTYAGFNRRDWEVNVSALGPRYVFRPADKDQFLPDMREAYRGREEYLEAMALWLESFVDMKLRYEGMIDLGERGQVDLLFFHGRGKRSGVPVSQPAAALIKLEDGAVSDHMFWWDRAAASKAIGVDLAEAVRSGRTPAQASR
jgi:ketosteroid isomerase-like protein